MIGVIIPAFNAARFLPACIASVRQQSTAAAEICVVDDGSTDETAAVATRLGGDIHVIRQPNRGPGAARNAGITGTRSALLTFLDADDLWPADHNAHLAAALAQRGSLLAIGKTQLVREERAEGEGDRGVMVPCGQPWHGPHFGSILLRREVFGRVGLLDERLRRGEDLDWFIRARERQIPTVAIPATTLHYRIHESNLTRGADAVSRNMFIALKRSLDRRRSVPHAP